MPKFFMLLFLTSISLTAFANEKFSFKGHVTLKNEVPEPIQLTLFEGDFLQAPDDEDTAAIKKALSSNGNSIESEIFYSIKNEKPNLLILVVKSGEISSILIIDLEKSQKYEYNISEIQPGRIVSSKAGFSDYILEVK